jgi:dihydropteroate synthase
MKHSLKVGDKVIDFSTPKIMGVLNVTPDSFYDGGKNNSIRKAIYQSKLMVDEGAEFIDVGGYSSRPGAKEVSVEEEISRTVPVVDAIHKAIPDITISIDTFRQKVAKQNIDKGATWVNDISAGKMDAAMIPWIKRHEIPYIAMHMRGNPGNMNSKCEYSDLTNQVIDELIYSVKDLNPDHPLILDPGFGFSKTLNQNYELMSNLESFAQLNKPFLVGVSRKSMIYKFLKSSPDKSLNGTTILNTLGVIKGASILRVHDVKEAREVVSILQKCK